MWFDSWSDILRVLIVGSAAYATLVAVLRVTGKRTLSQLNAFDFIVTVAFGSTLATILLSTDVSWAEGAAALGLLAALQLIVALISTHWPRARGALTAQPTLLLRHGVVQHEALRHNRLTESEVLQAVRASGTGDLGQVAAVVLETNGKLSVVSDSQFGSGSALSDIAGFDSDAG